MDDAQTIFIGTSVQRSLINRVGGALVRGLPGGPFRGR